DRRGYGAPVARRVVARQDVTAGKEPLVDDGAALVEGAQPPVHPYSGAEEGLFLDDLVRGEPKGRGATRPRDRNGQPQSRLVETAVFRQPAGEILARGQDHRPRPNGRPRLVLLGLLAIREKEPCGGRKRPRRAILEGVEVAVVSRPDLPPHHRHAFSLQRLVEIALQALAEHRLARGQALRRRHVERVLELQQYHLGIAAGKNGRQKQPLYV